MLVNTCRCNAATRGALQIALLNQKRFQHIFNGIAGFANGCSKVINTHRAAAKFFDNRQEQLAIHQIQANRVDKKDIYVRLCDEEGNAVISWKVINAFPTKLEGPAFSASSNEVAVETMELMADGVRVETA